LKFLRSKRENGLVELVCEHGVGHPSVRLTRPRDYYGTHGCDGCCSLPDFKTEEENYARPSSQSVKG
jgi:hypothetical protein